MADNFEEQNIKIKFDTNAKQAMGDTNALGASIEHTTDATNENTQAVKNQDATYKTFKTQLREANQELQKQIQLTGESSQETIKAAKAVAELKDQMGFASDLADKFNPDQKFKALGAATQIAGTGLQGVTAGMALFGGESADTQKQLLKVQAAMAFSDAISNLSNLGDQWKLLKATISTSTLFTKANTAATGAAAIVQNLFTGSVNASSKGFKLLKLAIAGTGIGLLVVGLALVVTNFDKITGAILKTVPGLSKVADFIGGIVQGITDFIGVTSEADRVVDRLKSNAEKRSKDIDRILKEDGSRYSESAKKKMAIEKQLQDDIADGIYNEQKLRKEAAYAIAQIDKENADKAAKAKKEETDKINDAQDKARTKREQKEKEIADKKKQEEAELQKAIEEQALNELNEKEKIRKIIEEAQDKKNEFNISAQDKELQDINDKYFYLIEMAKKFNFDKSEIELLEDQKANERNDVNLKYQTEVVKTQKDIDLENFNNKKTQKEALESLGNSAIAGAKDLFAKNKNVQKGVVAVEGAVALGKLTTGVVEQVGKDNTASPLTFGMPWSGIHIAQGVLGAASIVSSTNKQLQALGGGSISGGSNVSNSRGGGSPTPPPSVAFNNTAENQIGQSLAKVQADGPPIKVYVSESDISKAQDAVKVLVEKNTL